MEEDPEGGEEEDHDGGIQPPDYALLQSLWDPFWYVAIRLLLYSTYMYCIGNISRKSQNWVFGVPAESLAALIESKYSVTISKIGQSSYDHLTQVVIKEKGNWNFTFKHLPLPLKVLEPLNNF